MTLPVVDSKGLNGHGAGNGPGFQGAIRWAGERARRSCTRKVLNKRVPIFGWLPHYTIPNSIADLLAGITVGFTVIPQAIAYANVAGLPPQVIIIIIIVINTSVLLIPGHSLTFKRKGTRVAQLMGIFSPKSTRKIQSRRKNK